MRHVYATIINKRLVTFGYEYDKYVKNAPKIKGKYRLAEDHGIEDTNVLDVYEDIKYPKVTKFFMNITTCKKGVECIELLNKNIDKDNDILFVTPDMLRDLELFKKSAGSREFIPTDDKLDNLLNVKKKPILSLFIKELLEIAGNIPTDGYKETDTNIFKGVDSKHPLLDQPPYLVYNPEGYNFKLDILNGNILVYSNISDVNEVGKIISDTSVRVVKVKELPAMIDTFVSETDFHNSLYIDYNAINNYYVSILLTMYKMDEMIKKDGNGLDRKYILPTGDVYISVLYPPSLLAKAEERLTKAVNECVEFDTMDITDLLYTEGKKGRELRKEIVNKYIIKIRVGRRSISIYTGADLPARNHLKRLEKIVKSVKVYYKVMDKYIIHRTIVDTEEGAIFSDMPFNNKTFLVE